MLHKKASKNIRRLVREYGVSNPKGRRLYYDGDRYLPGTSELMDPDALRELGPMKSSIPMPKFRGPNDRKNELPGGYSALNVDTPLAETLGRKGSSELHFRVSEALTPFDKATRRGVKEIESTKDLPFFFPRDEARRYRKGRRTARKELQRRLENKLSPSVKGENRVQRGEARKELLKDYRDRRSQGLSVVTGKPMRRLFEKKAGAKRLNRLLVQMNKRVARGEEVPSSLRGAYGSAALKLQRRVDRNPQYNKEVNRRFYSEPNLNNFFAGLARGTNSPNPGVVFNRGGKMVIPRNIRRKY